MNTRNIIGALGLILSLLVAPAGAELCQDDDGAWRTCLETYDANAPVSDDWQRRAAEQDARAREEEWQAHQQESENNYQQRMDEIDQRAEQRRDASQQRQITGERKYNRALRGKSEVEQRYHLRQHSYDDEDVNKAYGR